MEIQKTIRMLYEGSLLHLQGYNERITTLSKQIENHKSIQRTMCVRVAEGFFVGTKLKELQESYRELSANHADLLHAHESLNRDLMIIQEVNMLKSKLLILHQIRVV